MSTEDDNVDTGYGQDDLAHEADLDTPLQHGFIRYVAGPSVPPAVKSLLPVKNDRPYIFVPVGYLEREKDSYLENILSAIGLKVPNLIVTTAETYGSADEQKAAYGVHDAAEHPVAKDWTEDQTREVIEAKLGRLLESTMESSIEVGAWVMPNCPRRRNGAVKMICEAMPKTDTAIALGIICLDANDKETGLTDNIKSSMAPLGSPLRTVSKIDYDTEIKDGAPSPELTHLLIFESPSEGKRFREEMLALVPDIMLAFGNITRGAMTNVFENATSGSPIVIVKHTGKNVDALCRMFRHVREHIAKRDAMVASMKQLGASATQGQLGESAGASTAGLSLVQGSSKPGASAKLRIPPIESEDDELIRFFINTWPANFSFDSLVLADPILMSGPALQKRLLGSITATFDLKSGGPDSKIAKRRVLDYAWSFYKVANRHSKSKKKSAELLHIQLVVCTLTSIIASVVYDQVYGGSKPAGATQLIVYVSTILLPLYITSLKQESDKGTAFARWTAFKNAATKIESEIYMFRTQVGPYRVLEKSESALQKPVEHFAKRVRSVWLGVKQHLNDDGMSIPDDFWDYTPISNEDDSTPAGGKDQGAKESGNEGYTTLPDENTKLLDNKQNTPVEEDSDSDDEENPKNKVYTDDKYSPMSADEYIECRMKGQMQKHVDKVSKMTGRSDFLGSTIKKITIFSGAAAALHLQWSVPIVLGVTAALGTGQEFRKYPRRIELRNNLVVQLNELKLWWMGLSMYQKQLPHNKDHLIQTTEKLIVSEMISSFDGPSAEDQD